jgi:hypothetical protein
MLNMLESILSHMQNSYRHLVVELRGERTSQSRILVKGKVVPNKIPENPDVCPLNCKKTFEPWKMFLTRHHADKRIGLFYCYGCPHLLFKSLIVPTHEAIDDAQLHENVKIEYVEDNSIVPHSTEAPLIVPIHSMTPVSAEPPMENIKEKIAPLITTSTVVDNKETRVLEHEGPSPTAMNEDFIMLTETLYKHFHTRGFDLICRRCGKPLEVGDLYHRTGASCTHKKFYHKGCWEALLN